MQTGVPAKPAANVARLAPGFMPSFEWHLLLPALVIVAIGASLPLLAFPILQRLGRLSRADAASVAALQAATTPPGTLP